MEFIELPPIGIFKLTKNEIALFPWSDLTINCGNEIYTNTLEFIENIFDKKLIIGNSINPEWLLKTDRNMEVNYFYKSVISTISFICLV